MAITNMARESYKRYDYDTDTGLITKTEQIKDYLDEKLSNISVDTDLIQTTIETSIDKSMDKIDCQFKAVNCHIENAKNEIINNSCGTCTCNLATKEDIKNAVCQINQHTDEVFSDLNEQVKNGGI